MKWLSVLTPPAVARMLVLPLTARIVAVTALVGLALTVPEALTTPPAVPCVGRSTTEPTFVVPEIYLA